MLITEERESINLFEQIIQQGKNSLKPQFKEITIEDREILNPYFDLVDYEDVNTTSIHFICGNMHIKLHTI